MRELLRELITAVEHGKEAVYCCLVETRGSTPQKAGASMLVHPDGSQVGTLGGGCVEAEVKRQALRVLRDEPRSQLLTFSLDNDYGWDDGLICGGRMRVLAAPLTSKTLTTAAEYYRTLQQLLEKGKGGMEAVLLNEGMEAPPGARFLFDEKSNVLAQAGHDENVPECVVENLPKLDTRPRASTKGGVAYLPFLPRLTLLIVGGGHVGQAVAELAAKVDFDIWVVDDRETYVNKKRFPDAERILVGDIGETLKGLKSEIKPSVYAVIVTRGHNHDEEALYHLAPTHAGYVGMIGSKRKIRLIYEDLLAKDISQEVLAKVSAPLGLDIGSQTVPEIAISIVAELIARRNKGTTEIPSRQDTIHLGTV